MGAQLLLDDARLMVAAIEDGVIGKLAAPLEAMGGQARGDPFRFVVAVAAGLDLDRVALAVLGPQLLFEQLGVVGDQRVGGLEDARGGSVVLFQLDHLQARIVVLQQAQVFAVGAAPGVDRLIIVTDGGEGIAPLSQQLEQAVLAAIGVLVLVHQQVPDPAAPALRDFVMLAEENHRQPDQVVEIHRLISAQSAFVIGVELRRGSLELVSRIAQRRFRLGQHILPQRDARLQGAQPAAVDVARKFLEKRRGIGRIENRKARLEADARGFLAQDAHAEGMKSADDHAFGAGADQLADAFLHLLRRLVGEGDGGNVRWRNAVVIDQPGDLVRDDARLARAGAGQHQQRSIEVAHGFELRRV